MQISYEIILFKQNIVNFRPVLESYAILWIFGGHLRFLAAILIFYMVLMVQIIS